MKKLLLIACLLSFFASNGQKGTISIPHDKMIPVDSIAGAIDLGLDDLKRNRINRYLDGKVYKRETYYKDSLTGMLRKVVCEELRGKKFIHSYYFNYNSLIKARVEVKTKTDIELTDFYYNNWKLFFQIGDNPYLNSSSIINNARTFLNSSLKN